MPVIFAQADSIWPNVIQALSNNGFWVFVGICVIAGTAKNIVTAVLKHRERLAMIEAGMSPPSDTQEGDELVFRRHADQQNRHSA